jgi:hypothetical protein
MCGDIYWAMTQQSRKEMDIYLSQNITIYNKLSREFIADKKEAAQLFRRIGKIYNIKSSRVSGRITPGSRFSLRFNALSASKYFMEIADGLLKGSITTNSL